MGKKFEKLERHIESEYENKGFSHTRSLYIARATAGKVYRCKKCRALGGNPSHCLICGSPR